MAKAERSATWAQVSAQNAAASAQAAYESYKAAYADAVAAGKAAQEAAEEAERELERERNQFESSQPAPSTGPNDESGSKRKAIGHWLGKGAGYVADGLGFAPSFLCPPCSGAGVVFGLISAVGYAIAEEWGEMGTALVGAGFGALLGGAGKVVLKKLLDRRGATLVYEARHYVDNIPKIVPTSIRVQLEKVVTAITGAIGLAYSIATGSYDDVYDWAT